MKLLFFFNLFFLCLTASAVETRSSVEFQWEVSKKAAEYEVQILDYDGKVLKELKSKTNNFRVRMPVNKYRIRGRIKTKLGNLSPWSKETDLIIPPNRVKITSDGQRVKILNADLKTLTSPHTIKWSASPQAVKYLVKLKDEKGEIVVSQEVYAPMCQFNMSPGKYKYSVTAIAPNGVESEEIESNETLEVKMASLPKPTYKKTVDKNGCPKFAFEKIPGTKIRGQLHYANFLGETWTNVESYEDLKESLWEASFLVKPGRYKVFFWTSANGASDSEKVVEDFIIKPKEPDLEILSKN